MIEEIVYAADHVCPSCLNAWPRTGVYFYKNPQSRDGLSSTCKSCFHEQSRRSRRLKAERRAK